MAAIKKIKKEQACAALTVSEFCANYRVSRNTVYAEIKAGRLNAKQVGRKKIIPIGAAEAWIDSLPCASFGGEV